MEDVALKLAAQQIRLWLELTGADGLFSLKENVSAVGENFLLDQRQGFLSVGLPNDSFACNDEANRRVFWMPNQIVDEVSGEFPKGKSLLIASSRIGNSPETKPALFDAMRTVACRMQPGVQFAITHESIATHQYIRRLAELFDFPVVEFRPFPRELSVDWFEQTLQRKDSARICFYDRPYDEWDEDHSIDRFKVDSFLAGIAKEARLLSVRGGGNILDSAIDCLQQPSSESTTYVLMNRQLTSRKVTDQLISSGAVPWYLYREIEDSETDDSSSETESDARDSPRNRWQTLASFAAENNLNEYLIHWTRRNKGPWPNQSENGFIDDLIFGTTSANHGKLQTLARILASKNLIANNQITRDNTPVVCFSEITVDELPELRRFRSHLGRWDFETVGLAIKRDVLTSLGARPVIYGDEPVWEQLAAHDRPYFQKQSSGSIDWTQEREWRLTGNLDLAQLATTDAFVFVENENESRLASELSRWQVVVIGNA